MKDLEKEEILRAVSQRYAEAAKHRDSCCMSTIASTCCQIEPALATRSKVSNCFIYSEQDILDAPEGAYLGLGCGNPLAVALVKSGETVLDLGSGAGFDCFLAARDVGDTGVVIGVDMTPEMVSKARENARMGDYTNVQFRLGEMENLPVADDSVDVVISNCVINLSPDKARVYSEAFRVLKPGGRLAIADMIAKAPLPEKIQKDSSLYCACIGGASFIDDLKNMLSNAGFHRIKIQFKTDGRELANAPVTRKNIEDVVIPATIEAKKPANIKRARGFPGIDLHDDKKFLTVKIVP